MSGRIFDRFMVAYSELSGEKHSELKVTENIQPGTDKLMVLLPPWHMTSILWNNLQKKLLKQDYSLLTYEVSEDILSSDGGRVSQGFKAVKDVAVKDIERLRLTGQFKTVDVAGLSLGTVTALYIVTSGVAINKLILISPSDDVPEGIYVGTRTRKIRRELDVLHKSLDDYRREMPELTMRKDYTMQVNNVEIVLSDVDDVIPYRFSQALAVSMKSKGIAVKTIRRPRKGHYLTFIMFCLTGKVPKNNS